MTTLTHDARVRPVQPAAHGPVEELVDLTGLLSGWCDRAEHNEGTARAELLDCGARLRTLGLGVLRAEGLDPLGAYSRRLRQMEAKNVLWGAHAPVDVPAALLATRTWRDVQLLQVEHDRLYHPDVFGLPRGQQLQHYVLHLAKLARHLQIVHRDPTARAEWAAGRVADLLVFGVKLATVANHPLADEPFLA